jgi:hypothetical protein
MPVTIVLSGISGIEFTGVDGPIEPQEGIVSIPLGGAAVSSVNTITGNVVLVAGTGISIIPAGHTLTFANTLAEPVTSLNTLIGDVTLTEGANITLTSVGNAIEIAATGIGGLTLIETQTIIASQIAISCVIPNTFKHLKIIAAMKGVAGGASYPLGITFNGDDSAIYNWASNDNTGPGLAIDSTSIQIGIVPGSVGTDFGAIEVDIPNYNYAGPQSLVSKYFSSNYGGSLAFIVGVSGGVYDGVDPIESITLAIDGSNMAIGSIVSVYGTM